MSRRKLFLLLFGVVLLAIAGPFIAISADSSKPEQLVSPLDAASVASKNFMTAYVSADGQVGKDNMQFGHQAQGLLIAAATSDRERFDTIWKRTQDLQKADKSFDAPPADLLVAARAFLVASSRLDNPAYLTEAKQLASQAESKLGIALQVDSSNVQIHATALIDSANVQLRTIDELSKLTGGNWDTIAQADRHLLQGLDNKLPANKSVNNATYGSDAQTIPLALKDSCNSSDHEVAKDIWLTLRKSRDARSATELNLNGSVKTATPSVKATVATAAAAELAGDHLQSIQLLDYADVLTNQKPSLDAAAWDSIGRITVSTNWLGACS